MKEIAQTPKSNSFLLGSFLVAVVIAASGAVMLVVNKNEQLRYTRLIEKTENETRILLENEIPILQNDIDKQLIRYDMRERLIANKTTLRPTPQANIIPINLTNSGNTAP